MPDQGQPIDGRKPRVVMLVGNFVDGDSRVQKEARWAAAAGWDAVLVGRSPSGQREEYALGGARVIRAVTTMDATRYRSAHPRTPLTGLDGVIAYRSQDRSRLSHRRQRMRQGDVAVRREAVSRTVAAGANPLVAVQLKASFGVHAFFVKGRGYWVALRKQAFDRKYQRGQAGPNGAWTLFRARLGGAEAQWDAQPRLADFEDAYGPVVDELAPDLIHANDADTLGIAVRAALRARSAGRTVRVVYDAHEYFAGEIRHGDSSWPVVMAGQERRYLPLVDGVSVVTETIADALHERYGLAERPTVVCNMPEVPEQTGGIDPLSGVRGTLGLAADVPLFVHAGMVSPVRGLEAVVRALPLVPEAHVALLVGSYEGHAAELKALAASLGCGDRFHLTGYVPPEEVTTYIATATAGVEALLHTPQHELALTTKFWAYLNARIPLVVSDVEAMAAMTREFGVGEVFTAGDPASVAAAFRTVIGERERFVKAYPADLRRFTWDGQMAALLGLYGEVTGLVTGK
jgi:glycosyltransferase involved in cell wall biosynthesis